MKNLRFYFVLFFITPFCTIQSYSQSYHAEFVGNETPCPGVTEHYTLVAYYKDQYGNKEGQFINNTTIWGRVGGVLVDGGWDGAKFIDVKWNDVKSGKLTVRVEMTKNEPGQYITVLATLNAKPMSITNVDPFVISVNNSFNYGDTSNRTYSINPILYPDSSATNIYKWTIPSGWSHSGTISNGTTLFTTSSPSIVVTPNVGCNGNEIISVYGVNDQCSGNPSSNTKQLHITRTWPSSIISGPNLICSSGSYSIANLPSGLTVNWTSSSNISLTSPQGTNPATFSKNSTGAAWIKAILAPIGCSQITFELNKDIWIGLPSNNNIDFGVFFSSPPNDVVVRYDNSVIGILNNPNETQQQVTKYNWDFGGWSSYIIDYQSPSTVTNTGVELYLNNYAPSSQIVIVKAENLCGTTPDFMAIGKMFFTDDYGGFFMMTMFPNPADTYVELSFTESRTTLGVSKVLVQYNSNIIIEKDKTAKDGGLGNYLVQILDGSGKIRKSSNIIDKKVRFETRDLEAGIYYVHVMGGGKVYKQQLIIN